MTSTEAGGNVGNISGGQLRHVGSCKRNKLMSCQMPCKKIVLKKVRGTVYDLICVGVLGLMGRLLSEGCIFVSRILG